MDISETLIPNSDQLDAADLAASGPRIFTIERVVVKSGAEQPVDVHLKEFPRPWRPGRNMRRVLAHVLGKDSSKWVGHKIELYYDGEVIFGKEKVGGSRISRMTGIDAPIKAPIIVGRGKRGTWPVQPLPDAPTPTTPKPLTDAEIACATDVDQLGKWWREHPDQRAAIEGRVAEIKAAATEQQP